MMESEQLIGLVQERRSLWDPKHSEYHNRDASRRLWCEIATLLHTTSTSVKTRWQRLKDSHRRELRKSHLPTGSASQSNESKWKYLEHMSFLKDMYTSRHLDGNISQPPQWNADNEPIEVSDHEILVESVSHTDQDDDGRPPPLVDEDKREEVLTSRNAYTRTRKDPLAHFLQLEGKKVAYLEQKGGTQKRTIVEDEDYFYFMSLLPYFRAIPQNKKLQTRVKLQEIIIQNQPVCNLPPSVVHEGTVTDPISTIELN